MILGQKMLLRQTCEWVGTFFNSLEFSLLHALTIVYNTVFAQSLLNLNTGTAV